MEEKSKVSVIIPIYGVEKFIVRCAESLLLQTLRDIEYIFVDDATPDRSIELLKSVINRYPERKHRIRIVSHKENKGLPAARNTGLAVATGEYVFHCDSDDYLEVDALEQMYNLAHEQDADIVWCDWFLTFEKNERYMKQPSYSSSKDALKAMLSGAMKYNVWNKLVRRSIYVEHQIEFPSGYGMGEDMTMMMAMAYADKVAYLPKAFYHYVKLNTNAFSQTYSDRHLMELKHNVARIETFMKKKFGNELEKEIAFLKLEAKFPFLIGNSKQKYHQWTEWYPEANKFIIENNCISSRSRLIQLCAAHNQFWIVRIYYWLVIKMIYGIIYK